MPGISMSGVAGEGSVVGAVVTAYRDVGHAVSVMRALFVAGVLIILATGAIQDLIPLRLWNDTVLGSLMGFAIDIVKSFCLTPTIIALHRHIILGDAARSYAPDPVEPGFMAFFGWLVALAGIKTLAFALPDAVVAAGLPGIIGSVAFVLALAVLLVVWIRLSILFPAIAVQAPGATAANAMADTRGHVVKMALMFLLAVLPCAAVTILVTVILGRGVARIGTPAAIVDLVAGAVLQMIVLWLCAAVASRRFQALGRRVLSAKQA